MGSVQPSRAGSAVAVVAVFATSCVALTDAQRDALYAPVDRAVSTSFEQLTAEADAGDATSQYALGLVYEHGLSGAPLCPALAAILKRRALAPRGYTPITQYTAAFNGQPSRINIINVPRYDFTSGQAALIETCIETRSARCEAIASLSDLRRGPSQGICSVAIFD